MSVDTEPRDPQNAHAARHRLWTTAISLLSAAGYALLGLVKLATYRATTFDLVIVDQAVRSYSRFLPGYIPSIGAWHGRGLDYPQIADHFSPLYAVLAPLYWIHDGPATLIIAQALLFAAAIPSIWLFTRRLLGTAPAYLVSLAYALSWPVAQAVNFDVHEVMFVPLLTALAIERYTAGKRLPAYLALFCLLLVKEDMGLMVAGFGAFAFFTGDRVRGLVTIAAGLGAAVLVRGVVMPAVGGQLSDFWAYGQFGADPAGALLGMLGNPVTTLLTPFDDPVKLDTLFLLFWPALLLALLSPLTLMALPHLAERFLSSWPQWWTADFQYNAFTVVTLLLAGVDGLARLLRWTRRADDRALRLSWAAAALAVALTLVPRFAFDQLLTPEFYRGDPVKIAAAAAAVAKVPDGVTVEAVNSLGPALTRRTTVLLWRPRAGVNAPWVVADTRRWEFPFGSLDEQRGTVQALLVGGYRQVFEQDGITVLRRS